MTCSARSWCLSLLLLAGCAVEVESEPREAAPSVDPLYDGLMDRFGSVGRHEAATTGGGAVGDVALLSTDVPDFPESTLSAGRFVAVSGPASFDITPGAPGEITLHDRWTGAHEQTIEVPFPAYLPPFLPNALSVAVPGALGDIYVNQVLTGIYRLNTLFGYAEQYTVEAVPDIPPCFLGGGGDCSASPPCPDPAVPDAPPCDASLGLPPLGNSLLMTEDGTLYTSDSFQGVIWKTDPVTRDYALWLTAAELQGNIYGPFPSGVNGMAIGPDGMLYFANTTAGPAFGGAIYRVPLVAAPTPAEIELVYTWAPFSVPGLPFPLPEAPDGLRFDVDGNLWVTLAFGNAVAKLTMSGGAVVGEDRYTNDPPAGGIPFHQPSELHLDSMQTIAFVGNHALEPPTPENWALFSVETGVQGAPLQKAWVGWDCTVFDCSIDWSTLDAAHAAWLVFEEAFGL